MTRGFPASGKSTWALEQVKKDGNIVRVNKDAIRLMLGSKWNPKQEVMTNGIRDISIVQALAAGKSVICDDTNTSDKQFNHLKELARANGVQFLVNDSFMDVNIEELLKRDAARQVSVGKDVILKFYHQHDAPPPEHCDGDWAVLCDLDGTLAIIPSWANKYDRDCRQDILCLPVRHVIDMLTPQNRIIFMSGRDEKYRAFTEEWLSMHDIGYNALFMRPAGDKRGDQFVKADLFREHVLGKYNVRFVLDDRPKVVRMWRHDFGLKVLQVAPDIEF